MSSGAETRAGTSVGESMINSHAGTFECKETEIPEREEVGLRRWLGWLVNHSARAVLDVGGSLRALQAKSRRAGAQHGVGQMCQMRMGCHILRRMKVQWWRGLRRPRPTFEQGLDVASRDAGG